MNSLCTYMVICVSIQHFQIVHVLPSVLLLEKYDKPKYSSRAGAYTLMSNQIWDGSASLTTGQP